jgi:hypothetical protein
MASTLPRAGHGWQRVSCHSPGGALFSRHAHGFERTGAIGLLPEDGAGEAIEIVGEQPEDENAPVPVVGPDGVFRLCETCQREQPPGAVRFFTHGTDELS